MFDGLELMPVGLYPSDVFIRRAKHLWPEILILLLAALLRLWSLDIKPPHFDEGVNGWFADQMGVTGYYRYDPTNYHGPLHMYGVFVSQTLFGRNVWALRLPAILASLLAVWALLRLKPLLGSFPSRFAALAMAVSPAFVFYGRYSIHESWLVAFLIFTFHGLLGLWQSGERKYLWLVALGVAGLILTKETYFIHLGCFALAVPALWLWQKVVPSRPVMPMAPQQWKSRDLALAGGVATLVIFLFYSGFLLDPGAAKGLYETYAAWFKTGVEAGGHEKPDFALGPVNFYWLALMAFYEWPGLVGVVACFWALTPVDARIRYAAISGAGALIAYSIIPYKTPWCLISVLWPFYLTAGAMIQQLCGKFRFWVAGLLVASSLPAMVDVNFRRFTDDSHLYVYVQTHKEINQAMGPLLKKAAKDPRFYHARGSVFLESYYPIPWILGDFTSVGYFDKGEIPEMLDAAFILCAEEDSEAVQAALAGPYYRRDFLVRSGVGPCIAFFRFDDFQEIFGGGPDVIGTARKPAAP